MGPTGVRILAAPFIIGFVNKYKYSYPIYVAMTIGSTMYTFVDWRTRSDGTPTYVVAPKGDLWGSQETHDLSDVLREIVSETQSPRIVMDMHFSEYVNSTGWCVVLNAHLQAKEKDGGLSITNAGEKLRNALLINRLCYVFDVYHSVEDALEPTRLLKR
jgi:anti-anti-sigma factor